MWFKKFFFRVFHWKAIIGMVVGAAGAFMYYYYIGCVNGSCPITSNPYKSLAWGLVFGWLLGDAFHRNNDQNSKKMSS